MPEYGDEFGEEWGDAIADIETHVDDALKRLTYAFRDAENFRKVIAIHAERAQLLENAIRGVTPTLLFDIETAYGIQLDQIGNILFIRREGWDDVTYRVYLRTQALLVLPFRKTQARLLEVIRSLMNTDAGTIEYKEYRPKTYTIQVPTATLAELVSWKRFLELCRPATYNSQTLWLNPNPFGFVDSTATVAPTMGPYSDASGTLAPSSFYSAVV